MCWCRIVSVTRRCISIHRSSNNRKGTKESICYGKIKFSTIGLVASLHWYFIFCRNFRRKYVNFNPPFFITRWMIRGSKYTTACRIVGSTQRCISIHRSSNNRIGTKESICYGKRKFSTIGLVASLRWYFIFRRNFRRKYVNFNPPFFITRWMIRGSKYTTACRIVCSTQRVYFDPPIIKKLKRSNWINLYDETGTWLAKQCWY